MMSSRIFRSVAAPAFAEPAICEPALRDSAIRDSALRDHTVPVPAVAGSRRLRFGYTPAMLVVLLSLLNGADLVTTQLVLDRGGSEGNPLMRPFVEQMWGAAALKIACLLVIASLVQRCPRSPRLLRGLTAVVVWYGVVVAWNVALVARAA